LFSGVPQIISWFGHSQPEVRATLERFTPGRVQSFAFFTGQEDLHASAYYLRCVGSEELCCPSLTLAEEERQWLNSYWQRRSWRPDSRVLVIQPGSGGKKKRWASEGFAQAARWWKSHKNRHVLILLGPAEEEEEDLWRQVGEVEKELSLCQLAALLSRADVYLGNDSGVSHLAGAVGARGTVLFGPTRPQQWRPLGGALSVLHNVQYRTAIPQDSGISLKEIPVEEVIAGLVYHGG
jgi:ADP-heptose:LPS heptosyltransferase